MRLKISTRNKILQKNTMEKMMNSHQLLTIDHSTTKCYSKPQMLTALILMRTLATLMLILALGARVLLSSLNALIRTMLKIFQHLSLTAAISLKLFKKKMMYALHLMLTHVMLLIPAPGARVPLLPPAARALMMLRLSQQASSLVISSPLNSKPTTLARK